MTQSRDNTISDWDLQAVIDGEFDTANHSRIMDSVKENPALLARLEELFDQKCILQEWWRCRPAD